MWERKCIRTLNIFKLATGTRKQILTHISPDLEQAAQEPGLQYQWKQNAALPIAFNTYTEWTLHMYGKCTTTDIISIAGTPAFNPHISILQGNVHMCCLKFHRETKVGPIVEMLLQQWSNPGHVATINVLMATHYHGFKRAVGISMEEKSINAY